MQKQPKEKVTVNILGNEYSLKGDSPPDQIRRAAEYVDDILHKLHKTNRHINLYKLLVLTSVNLADELLKLKDEKKNKKSMQQLQIDDEKAIISDDSEDNRSDE